MATLERPPSQVLHWDLEVLDILKNHKQLLIKLFQEYPYWSKLKYQAREQRLGAEQLWVATKYYRQLQAEVLTLHDRFYLNVPAKLQHALHQLDMHCGGNLQSYLGPLPNSLKDRFIISSLLTEAFSSSTLEGAVSTRDRAKELIRQGKKPRTKDERMIVNNYLAMEFLRAHRNDDLTSELLMELHDILSKDPLDQGRAGQYRDGTQEIYIHDDLEGEMVYLPPPAEQVVPRMEELIRFFNYRQGQNTADLPWAQKLTFVHPILQATIIHFMVGYIHPFADGNGRMARALFYWHMLRNGYWMAEYLSISQVILQSKHQYYRAFLEVEQDENDLTYFLLYHTKALLKAFESLKAYLERQLKKQRIDLADQAARLGVTPRQAEMLSAIDKSANIWTVQQTATYLTVSENTARAELNALTDKGLLERFQIDKKSQGWRLKPR